MLINLKRATPGEGEPDLKFAAVRIHEMGLLALFPSCAILLLKLYYFKCLDYFYVFKNHYYSYTGIGCCSSKSEEHCSMDVKHNCVKVKLLLSRV